MSAADEVSRQVFDQLVAMPVSRPVAMSVALAVITGSAGAFRELADPPGVSREDRLRLLNAVGEFGGPDLWT